jgi:DNA-directed RNA polymerase specialized sigma24 family protein
MTRKQTQITVYGETITVNRRTGEGLQQLYLKIDPKITSMSRQYRVVGKDYEDNKQDLQIKVWNILKTFDETKSCFASYYILCLTNFIKDQNKRKRVREENNMPDRQIECADTSYSAMFVEDSEE